jgi:hypothetical protein
MIGKRSFPYLESKDDEAFLNAESGARRTAFARPYGAGARVRRARRRRYYLY